jgi:cytochrome c oxidase subunit IV
MSNETVPAAANGAHTADQAHSHASTYFLVLVALSVLTLVEVLVSHITASGVRIFLLVAIALLKAYLVAQYYMHLKYENRLLFIIFAIPIVAATIILVLIGPMSALK